MATHEVVKIDSLEVDSAQNPLERCDVCSSCDIVETSAELFHNEFSFKLSPKAESFLKFIKSKCDLGKPTYISDIQKRYGYEKHSMVSRYLTRLKNLGLIKKSVEKADSSWKKKIEINKKGINYLRKQGLDCFSELAKKQIKIILKKGKPRSSYTYDLKVIYEYNKLMMREQPTHHKMTVLREFEPSLVLEPMLNNISEGNRDFFIEMSDRFLKERYKNAY